MMGFYIHSSKKVESERIAQKQHMNGRKNSNRILLVDDALALLDFKISTMNDFELYDKIKKNNNKNYNILLTLTKM
jgi:hypothetical protein